MLRGRAPVCCSGRRIQIRLKECSSACSVCEDHWIDVLGERNGIQLERLPACTDDLPSFEYLDCSDWLRGQAIAPPVQFILRMRVARFQKWPNHRLVTFFNKDGGAHSGCG